MLQGRDLLLTKCYFYERYIELMLLGVEIFETIGISGRKKSVRDCLMENLFTEYIPLIFQDEELSIIKITDILEDTNNIKNKYNMYKLVGFLESESNKYITLI